MKLTDTKQYTVREALHRVRKMGFSTVKSAGTWYISKPYHTANCLVEIDNNVMVALSYEGNTSYVKLDELEP